MMSMRPGPIRDDHVLAPTRWVSAAVVPVLVAAFVILFVYPSRTDRLWGWTVRPRDVRPDHGGRVPVGRLLLTRAATSGNGTGWASASWARLY